MKIADVLPLYPDRLWTLAKQVGVTHAVSRLPLHENGETSFEYADLLALKQRFENFGFKLFNEYKKCDILIHLQHHFLNCLHNNIFHQII
jgi:hypothetical protein